MKHWYLKQTNNGMTELWEKDPEAVDDFHIGYLIRDRSKAQQAEDDATAGLIAAVPEMWEACRLMLKCDTDGPDSAVLDAYNAAAAAAEKAAGGQ